MNLLGGFVRSACTRGWAVLDGLRSRVNISATLSLIMHNIQHTSATPSTKYYIDYSCNLLTDILASFLAFTHRRCSWSQCSRPHTNIYSHRPGLGTCRRSCTSRLHSRQCLHGHKYMKLVYESSISTNC